ncbi:MAG: insulinase family protein [Desulfovibrio sp.]|nr:insulinase family protein [Desulfovibrio sp.]
MNSYSEAYHLLDNANLSEVGGCVNLWEHVKTKAQILSICNDDENKCFGVSFKTPPSNSTGVAHILEHSVLCGSKLFPVKEPFVELLKGSLQTFLNAFTFPDKTCYPVASANLQDFYNLIDVYLDAVFFPLITEDTFRQEGWHIEANDQDGPWTYKGVVYNEMKGAYSSPDAVLAEQSQQALFPDTLYSLDSGGNPEVIPELTYQDFCSFHSRYYHPSNARFFFWGNDPEPARLQKLAALLEAFSYRNVDSDVPSQRPFKQPVTKEVAYAAGNGVQKNMFTINWLLGERGDVNEALQMEMLQHILEGMSGSPLQRALISSGLGEETTGCGLETDLKQMYYSTGLKGIKREDISRAEGIIFDTLTSLVRDGIESSTVEAAVNTVEFDYRERNTGPFPRGLSVMIQALSTWLYGGNPIEVLAWEKPLNDIKNRLASGEKVFENLIQKRFLDNPHRALVILTPDTDLGARRERKEAERLQAVLDGCPQNEREEMVRVTKELQEAQVRPDSAEALATIPSLSISDLPLRNPVIRQECLKGAYPFYAYEQPTCGIAYVSLLFPLEAVPERLYPLLPLFSRTITEIGTAKHDYTALGELISARTGGVGAGITFGTKIADRGFFRFFRLGGKAVYGRLDDLFEIFDELIFCPQDNDAIALERIGQMLLETRARLEEAMQSSGHGIVMTRLDARYSAQGAAAEQTAGVSYLEYIRGLLDNFEKNPGAILDDLRTLRSAIFASEGSLLSCTAESSSIDRVRQLSTSLFSALPKKTLFLGESCEIAPFSSLPHAEALITPSRINYVGKSVNLYDAGWKYMGQASVILRSLRMGYLWEQVRVRGGAYGAFCSFQRARGTLLCVSYRDPNTGETLACYDRMASFLSSFNPTPAQLTQAIVGAVGDLDTYLLPSARGAVQLGRMLSGDNDEVRQKMREEMLSTKPQDFKDFAEILALLKNGDSCILGGGDAKGWAEKNGWTATTVL